MMTRLSYLGLARVVCDFDLFLREFYIPAFVFFSFLSHVFFF